MDRYAIRLTDSTGKQLFLLLHVHLFLQTSCIIDTMDITLWEEAGHDSRRLRVGQYILLDHLVTSDRHQSTANNKMMWYVNGSVLCGTKIYNSMYTCY